MKKAQQGDVNMFEATISYITSIPAALLLSIPNFNTWFAAFVIIVDDIFINMEAQGVDRKGFRKTKNDYRTDLKISALNYATIMMSYATSINDMVLYNKMNLNKSKLDRASDLEIIPICSNILSTATPIAPELVPYGVTAGDLTDFGILIENYRTARPKVRLGITDKKEATLNLKTLMTAAHAKLKNVDGAVNTTKLRQPAFWHNYFQVRKIVDLPKELLAARGKITSNTGNPMPFVHITCAALGIKRKANKSGTFIFKNAPEGIHEITYAFPGYQTITQAVTIYPGLRAEINVTMIPH